MKTTSLFSALVKVCCVLILGSPLSRVCAITLTGANGRAVEFAGIKDATPKGITAQLKPDSPLIGVPWSKLDLEALKKEQQLIFAAYERTQSGETISLNLGSYGEPAKVPGQGGGGAPGPKYKDWIDTNVGSTEFMMQLPLGKPRGILLLAVGERGHSFRQVMGFSKGTGPWGPFQSKYDFALLTYDFDDDDNDPTTLHPFAYAEKSSGDAVLKAIASFAGKLKNPDLVNLPIAVYGADQLGASFAYHFTLYKPELVMAAVCSEGAFYDATPTEAAAAVPILFARGQYSNVAELWKSENSAEAVLAKYASMNPNWTHGRELRGTSSPSPILDHFEKSYLLEMIGDRLPEKKVEKPTEAPAEGEGEESESENEEEEEDPPIMLPFERANGYVGTLKTGETLKLTDPGAELQEGETFLPNSEIAQMWKLLVTGELTPPPPPPLD